MSAPRVLITGTNRGVGKGIAAAFHQDGYDVSAVNRTASRDEWQQQFICDLSDLESTAFLAEGIESDSRPLDVCVINAGLRVIRNLENIPIEEFRKTFEVNVVSAVVLCKAVLPKLAESKGDLIFVGSNSAIRPFEGGAAYCASKAALSALAKVLDLEYGPKKVRISTVIPGSIANRSKTNDENKMTVDGVARIILSIVKAPPDVHVREVHLEPANALFSDITGIERLLYKI